MTWTLRRWTWVLDGPLFVGHVPAGSLNRCRLYIPARAAWGAVTAEAARLAAKKGEPLDYTNVGRILRENARFTYLYPAQYLKHRWVAWLPRFDDDGLCWQREDGEGDPVAERSFRRRLLSTRPGTAIDPTSEAAEEGSLRETECVSDRWHGENTPDLRVAYVGYVFTRSEAHGHVARPKRLFVGGDTRYGLGSLSFDSWDSDEGDSTLFGNPIDVSGDSPSISAKRVLAHANTNDDESNKLRGSRERVTGRDQSKLKVGELPSWVPGSVCDANVSWTVSTDGTWTL